MKSVRRLLNIKKGEGDRAFRFFLYFFFLIASFVVGKTARDTFFLSRFDPAYLPQMFIVVAISVAATVAIYTHIARQFSLIPMVMVTSLFFAASLVIIQIFLSRWIYPLLYVWMEVIATVMMFQFWLVANSAFTTREAKRLFALISSGGALANILVGFSIRPFVRNYGTDLLLVITTGFILLCFAMVYVLRHHVVDTSSSANQPMISRTSTSRQKKSRHFLNSSYLKTVTLIIGISAIISSLIDYQFKITASQSLDEAGMASLFGLLYGIIGVASFFMQFFVTGRILSRFGILWGLMFLPAALATGNLLILLSPVVASALAARAGDQIFRYTIQDTSGQLLWLPVAPYVKAVAKPFIDGTVKNSAQGLSGLLIIGLIRFLDVRFLSIPSLLLLTIWVVANFRLKKGYVTELRNAIEKRRLDFKSLEFTITDPLIVETLRKALVEGDDHQELFALESMKDLSLSAWASDLRELCQNASPIIKRKLLELCRDDSSVLPDENVLRWIKSAEESLAAEAMILCGERKLTDGAPILQEMLTSGNDRLRAAAAAGLMLLAEEEASDAKSVLESMLFHSDNDTQVAALRSVGNLPSFVTDEDLETLLLDDSSDVRSLAIQLSEQRDSKRLINPLVENLKNPKTALAARHALKSYESALVVKTLVETLKDDTAVDSQYVGIIGCLGEFADAAAIDALLAKFSSSGASPDRRANEGLRQEIADSLLKIARQKQLSDDQHKRVNTLLKEVSRRVLNDFAFLEQIEDDDHAYLLKDHLRWRILQGRSLGLKLCALSFPDAPIETYLYTLQSGDALARSNLLEILDNVLASEIRQLIVPLLEDSPLNDKIHKREKLFGSPDTSKQMMLLEWINSGNEWQSAIALDYVLKQHITQLLSEGSLPDATRESEISRETIEWQLLPPSDLHRQLISRELKHGDSLLKRLPSFPQDRFLIKEDFMYSTLEKTIFLKGVRLFGDIPGEEVSHIAQISQEVHFNGGEIIFQQGDAGDSMYIIVDGEVRIHKDDTEIALLGKGEFMGEMALLDRQPRSASATTTKETILLQIGRHDFYDLMATRMEIIQGIVKVLTQRLREAIP